MNSQKQKYVFTNKDKKEIRSLLIFLSGVLDGSPIKNIEFTRSKSSDKITIQRWDDNDTKTFSHITQTIHKKR